MLSYQHIYHAGNFADVHKHAILAQVLRTLRAKPAAMSAIDTHAGRGLYDLGSDEAEKNREFDNGITHLWPLRATPPAALKPYLDVVAACNPQGTLAHYPGSAMIARAMMRPSDKLVAVERHPGEFNALSQSLAGKPQTAVISGDGLKELAARVPPPELRGIAVIDPSYEIKTEYAELPRHIYNAWKKWPQGVFFIWYPIMDAGGHVTLLSELLKFGLQDTLVAEMRLEAMQDRQKHFRMTGTGVIIVNPPWPEATLADISLTVAQNLPVKAYSDVFWLNNRRIDPDTGLIRP